MTKYSNYINSILRVCKLEKANNIFCEKLGVIPIWSTVILQMRGKFTEKYAHVAPISNHPKFNLRKLIFTTIKSFYQICSLYFSGKSIENVIYGFPRLEQINGNYVDKFCDELILQTELSESYVYFARSRSFDHPQPRNLPNVVWVEFVDNIGVICGILGTPLLYLINRKKFKSLFSKANNILSLTYKDKIFIIRSVGTEVVRFFLTKRILKKLQTKRVFSPVLPTRPFLIAAAKSLDLPCFELQHGMTEGPTRLYSGEYLADFSPTAFLAFGKSSLIRMFNVPMEKMFNIGFAYKTFLLKQIRNFDKKHYLFVSNTAITQSIIDVACDLKKLYPDCKFSIRFHPHEKPSPKQIQQLKSGDINITDNKENSSIAILKYEGVIGEISTMLYEALTMRKKAAKIHFHNLNPDLDEKEEKNKGFFILNGIRDFADFIDFDLNNTSILEFYSEFNEEEFNKILKISHFAIH